ncbi:hypothetical protein [Bradyrhizobium jicamae]|uniref:hypothetical protein n=1 Tax=Bradyrhizobium jicamae TaxID=280332 RepID=UPI001BA9C547|nr:hypothetical protein [Bradyrhizobium jicamae]MBR0936684.1 hypothetical protein [Bradyrhizobium jicamae]
MAIGASTFSDLGGAVSDLFAGFGASAQANLKAQSLQLQAQGDLAEASNYDLASTLASQNEAYTKTSTAIQQMQLERSTYQQIGGQQAAIGGAGLAASGSATDILADSARQGALSKAVLGQQGLITEAGYQEQAQSYTTLAGAARAAAATEDQMAQETKDAGSSSAFGNFLGGALKGVATITSLLAGPEVAVAGQAAASAVGDATGIGGLY